MDITQQLHSIVSYRHPAYTQDFLNWEHYRRTFNGGTEFRDRYLQQFSSRETSAEFTLRKSMTPVPSFAAAAIKDVRNSIFQRLVDISRSGGSAEYQGSVAGELLGVDKRGSSMNSFIGSKVLTELLVMGRVGIYLDNSVSVGDTLADSHSSPYAYAYPVEDILSWSYTNADEPSEFRSLLLRDTAIDADSSNFLPVATVQRYRHLWLAGDRVWLQFYDAEGNKIDRNGFESGPIMLELERIPFVMPDINGSLLADVWTYQVALLNLVSRDMWQGMQSSFPIYTEQQDTRAAGTHLKPAGDDGTAAAGEQGSGAKGITVGATHGRIYGQGLDRPDFIAPPTEPLVANLAMQKKFEEDIRKLVNLAVQSKASNSSAQSKQLDNQGLEAGLSWIGLVLEKSERQLAKYWAAYEDTRPARRRIATIRYPDRYSLKTDGQRIQESRDLSDLMFQVPSQGAKKQIAKQIVTTLFAGRIRSDLITDIHGEIDSSDYLTSSPETILQAIEVGICDRTTGSNALGFNGAKVVPIAKKEHTERLAEIAAAQSSASSNPGDGSGDNPAARGIDDQDPSNGTPDDPAAKEKQQTRDNNDTK